MGAPMIIPKLAAPASENPLHFPAYPWLIWPSGLLL